MSLIRALALTGLATLALSSLQAIEPRFESTLTIPQVSRPTTVHAGDFNKDGKLDLVTANGTDQLTVLLQEPSNRSLWMPVPLTAGLGTYFARAVKIEPVYEREYPEIAALLRPAGSDASGGAVAANEGKAPGVNKAASIGTGPDPRKAKWIP